MKLIAGVSLAFVAFTTRSLAQNCCPAVKIIHATLETEEGVTQRLRKLAPDAVCEQNRTDYMAPFADSVGDLWQLTGENLYETHFTRFVFDLTMDDSQHWTTVGDNSVPQVEKVLALTVREACSAQDSLIDACTSSGSWLAGDPADHITTCEADVTVDWNFHTLAHSLADRSVRFVILPEEGAVELSWNEWYAGPRWTGGLTSGGAAMCGLEGAAGCSLRVGARSAADLITDVHNALQLDDTVDPNPFEGCDPCMYTTTTTTTTTTEASTTTSTTVSEISTTPTQPPTTDATTSGGRATVAMATVLPSLIVSTFGVAAILI